MIRIMLLLLIQPLPQLSLGLPDSKVNFLKSGRNRNRMWADTCRRIRPEPDSVIAVPTALHADDVHEVA